MSPIQDQPNNQRGDEGPIRVRGLPGVECPGGKRPLPKRVHRSRESRSPEFRVSRWAVHSFGGDGLR